MKREDKDLLLKDLCARLLYGVKIEITWWVMGEGTSINTTLELDHIEQLLNDEDGVTEIKPYLRSMLSMTEEERAEYERFSHLNIGFAPILMDWIYAHHFDCSGFIEKGFAIEVTKENNPYN